MKTYVYQDRIALDALTVVERPDPTPGPYDMVVRMLAASLNFRDLAMARGHYHADTKAPMVPLSDGVGEVVQIGASVTRFQIGDRVCPTYLPDWIDGPLQPAKARRRLGGPSDGVLTEAMCVHEEAAVRAPRHLDHAEAATLPITAVTAWHVLYRTGCVRPGETVLVQGTGGISLAALQFARAGGARVVALTRGDRHAAKLRELGASDVIPRGDAPDWPRDVIACTGGRGVDVAVDVVGGPSLARTIAATRLGATLHLVGYTADTSATIDIFDAIRHGANVHAATAGSRESFESMVRALEAHSIRPPVDRVFAFDRARDALEHLASGGHFGKVVIEFSRAP
ncbi:NAD(P)-dependent alcohol dehydrogenase [Pendulispora albinea]|uniref:NAD(P)-dependent alcohol dehydrogenase n=1 Tax=Pendulispora albinea TaxID=2741071 RepID=A0ABZ2LSM4_9BACT